MLPAQSQYLSANQSFRFFLLVGAVFISGVSQGMLLPLISILLEQAGTAPAMNGLNATALYIGVVIASPFIEKPTYTYGYKPVLISGLMLVTISMALFPIWQSFWIWFFLRLIVGIGDNMLHFAAQIWITVTSPPEKKGRNIAFYGLAFGSGFAVGPLLSRLVSLNESLPFIIAASGCLIFLILMFFLTNDFPESYATEHFADSSNQKRHSKVIKLAWAGLLTTFAYGFLEASLNSNFPVFALRNGYTLSQISILLPTFVVGSLISQVPLGALSDRFGRQRLIAVLTLCGTIAFSMAIIYYHSFLGLFVIFLIAGIFIGTLFSMGMTFVSDLLPNSLLPLGNILAGVSFSIGSIIGPLTGGYLINVWPHGGFFFGISSIMFLVFLSCTVIQSRK